MRELLPNVLAIYTQGIVRSSIGQVAGRIESLPVAEIMQQTVEELPRRSTAGQQYLTAIRTVHECVACRFPLWPREFTARRADDRWVPYRPQGQRNGPSSANCEAARGSAAGRTVGTVPGGTRMRERDPGLGGRWARERVSAACSIICRTTGRRRRMHPDKATSEIRCTPRPPSCLPELAATPSLESEHEYQERVELSARPRSARRRG
jgi:hypothetical protein